MKNERIYCYIYYKCMYISLRSRSKLKRGGEGEINSTSDHGYFLKKRKGVKEGMKSQSGKVESKCECVMVFEKRKGRKKGGKTERRTKERRIK